MQWQYGVIAVVLLTWVIWVGYHWLKQLWLPKPNKRRKYKGI
ncbi:hypothetical protein [Adhaeribacter pallidiroseus]|uniref:Uncharacterized protein n=1 Tax=Adhaeribacter pallidiroseus TaxID=2072847 RepID=A0A369QNK6_9BACT|nr:hypothetical protein [Adhaeribacter pallidiroseus]RDC65950.1 hypothetical protein AHMF7616_04581 [Adhaeribacter pallidiroseus]